MAKKTLSNSEELILICARTQIDDGLLNRARALLEEGLDWDLFLQTALKSGLPLLLHNALKMIDHDGLVPKEAYAALKNSYFYSVTKVTARYKEAVELLGIFFDSNIPAMPLKGPFLSRRLYGDIAVRGLSVDFDLLVEEKNKELAKRLLEGAGYLFAPGNKDKEWNGQWMFSKSGMALDLHWSIKPDVPNKERMPGLWKAARLKDEDGVYYYEPGEEVLIILLSAHFIGSSHFRQLRYICDINELLTKYRDTLNWQAVVEKSKGWRLSNSVYAALSLSKSLLQSYIPDDLLLSLKPGFFKSALIKTTVSRKTALRDESAESRFMKFFLKHLLIQMLEAKSFKDIIMLIFPSREVMGERTYISRLTQGAKKLKYFFIR